jgi:hypothetical protein
MEFWWEKKSNIHWLPTFKKHSLFESSRIWNLKKIKIYWTNLFNFKSLLPHVNGV